jgi:protein TonB
MTVELIQEESKPQVQPQEKNQKTPVPSAPSVLRESGGDPDKAPGQRQAEQEGPAKDVEGAGEPTKAPEPDRKPDVAAEHKIEPKAKAAPKSARRDPVATAPKQATSLSELTGEGGGDRYLNEIVEEIRAKYVYPAVASALGLSGVARYEVVLDRNGKLVEVRLATSTGVGTLDDAGLQAIQRAAPFPPIPADIGRDVVRVTVTMALGPERR